WPSARAAERLRTWTRIMEFARDDEARRRVDGADLAAAILAAVNLRQPAGITPALVSERIDFETRVRRLLTSPPPAEATATASKAVARNGAQRAGSIKLTGQASPALGRIVEPAAEADLPNSPLRFGRVISPPANEARVVSPVTGSIARPPRVELGASVTTG